ncbi:MAG TPA: c-type cytochrome, partial [Methylomirabilota bacterium]|nr:c-type cytochrome [Methylomirabilota bacterium]
MKRGLGVVVVLLLGAAAVAAAAAPLVVTPTQDPAAGARVFGAKGCAGCHAVRGAGGRVGPDLGRLERPRSFYDLAA